MKTFILCVALSFSLINYSSGQVLCILCYDQNDSISTGVTNLILDGGFENSSCQPGYIGDVYCPNSQYYSCDLPNWTCTGGGLDTYACLFNYATGHSIIVQGTKACYMGNWYCQACSGNPDDTSCLANIDCSSSGIPAGYPINLPDYGGNTGLSLAQTVNGLTPGNTYVLEFWAGGEQDYGLWPAPGVFGLDVGFGDTLLRNPSTPNVGGVGKRYIVEFNATSSSQTIKFTNWGHICSGCTELVLDDVRLYTLDQLDPSVPACFSNLNPSFVASDTLVCQKFCVNFFDSSQNNPTAWLWQFPGGSPPTSTDQNPINICYNAPGQYDVTLITTNAGGNDTLTLLNYITVYPTPAFPTITQNGYTLTSSTATSYQWQLNSVDIPGATDQSYEVMQTGFYTVIVGDENGCANSTTLYVEITGINELNDAGISISPNPTEESFVIDFSKGNFSGNISIKIFNAIGQQVYYSEERMSEAPFEKKIHLSNAATGIYLIELKSGNELVNKRIMVTQQK